MARSLCKGRKKQRLIYRAKELREKNAEKQRQRKQEKDLKDLNKRREIKRAKTLAYVPYTPDQTILLLGEGDFSFALSLLRKWEQKYPERDIAELGKNLLCTCYDSKSTVYKKYSTSKENIKQIRKKYKANVLTKIDATLIEDQHEDINSIFLKLPKVLKLFSADEEAKDLTLGEGLGFDKVIFNFPHLGQGISDKEQSAKTHREFLQKTSLSVWNYLNPTVGEFHLTIKRGEPYKSWKIGTLIKSSGFYNLGSTIEFYPSSYPGYAHKRTSGDREDLELEDNEDITKLGAYTLVFRKLEADI